jgi:F0F1-type ATP synthase alpha subunit
MDSIETNQIGDFEEQLLSTIKKDYMNILDDIKTTSALNEENENLLKETLEKFLENFKKNS